MANLVLYRKYRPKTFAEVVGQEHIVKTLQNAVQNNLLSHAYMFSGPRGAGKTTLARLLAKAANCKTPKAGEPCNTCQACKDIMQNRALDLVEIDAASNRGIDEIRNLKEGIAFAPAQLTYKVFIIDEAHQLSKDAANALLKTLEEPPAHAIFILATTEAHKMIPTIASRCQRFDFRKLRVSEIIQRLQTLCKKEGIDIEKQVLELLAVNAGGSLRDAEGLLDKVLTFHHGFGTKRTIDQQSVKELLGIADIASIAHIVSLLQAKDAAQAIGFLNKVLQEGTDPQELAKNLVAYLRQVLVVQINPDLQDLLVEGLTTEQEEVLAQQAQAFQKKHLQYTIEQFMEAENKMKYASIIQLPLELAIIQSCSYIAH